MGMELEPGQVLDNRFRLDDVINRGGMATVFKAIDLKTNETCAIKAPYLRYESDPAFYTRFQQEDTIGAKLNHPYILRILTVENKSRPYLVMELLEGQTLDKLLNKNKPLPAGDALKLASQICDALDYMHKQQIVHRDLKPQNIMVCSDGSPRIMDFGIAKALGKRRITFVGFSPAMGTPEYMAPEQVKGKRGDERTDIYSLGAILYEMTTGAQPFAGDSPDVIMNSRLVGDPVAPRKINAGLSPNIEEIILHAMERDPDRRYSSALAMKAELDAPDAIEVTGRCDRLQVPVLAAQRTWLMILAYAAIPIIAFVILYLIYRQ